MPTYTLGPEDGILSVHTERRGTVAKAGHDLLLHVTTWSATLDLDAPSLELDADPTSLRVREGRGGMMALDERRVTGAAVLKQTDWGMKPYTALFGALKVADEVRVEIDAELQSR